MVTSMREHKGYLFIGGILNNRVGRYRIEGADPNWIGLRGLLGEAAMILDPILDIFRGKAITIPPLDGAFRPNTRLDDAPVLAELQGSRQPGGCRRPSAREQRQRRLRYRTGEGNRRR